MRIPSTVFAAIQAVYRGTRTAGLVTALGAVAVALFALADFFYLRSAMYAAQKAATSARTRTISGIRCVPSNIAAIGYPR